MIERRDGGTPLGGVYSVWLYTDDEGNDAPKERATRALVSEYDADDNWLGETVLVLKPAAIVS